MSIISPAPAIITPEDLLDHLEGSGEVAEREQLAGALHPDLHLVARLDGAYPDRRLGLEFDGQGVHGAVRAIFHDRWRQNRLLALGWTLLRFTWWDVVHDPKGFVAAVRAALSVTRERSW